MNTFEVFKVPNHLEYPRVFEETKVRFSETPVEELTRGVRTYRDSSNGMSYYEAGPQGIKFAEGLEETNSLLVYELPFANGDSSHKKLTTQALADITNTPVVTILSPGAGGSKPKYSKEESKLIAKEGDFRPHGERVVETIGTSTDGLVGKVAFIGWSQGGATVLRSADVARKSWDVLGVSSGDSPTHVGRNLSSLFGAFGEAGYPELRREIELSGYKPILEAFGFIGKNPKSDFSRTVEYGRSIVSSPKLNTTYVRGLTHKTVVGQVAGLLQNGVPVTLANAKDSAITPKESFADSVAKIAELIEGQEIAKFRALQFEGNHTAGDNLNKLGMLAAFALGKAKTRYE